MALKGSLVPAYGINSLLSNIPLLGDVLASKKGEGIFGVTYSATGNADQPNISVNPLSVLTPGILRRIFEGHMPNAANAPSNTQRASVPPRAARGRAIKPRTPPPQLSPPAESRPASPARVSSCRWRVSARHRC